MQVDLMDSTVQSPPQGTNQRSPELCSYGKFQTWVFHTHTWHWSNSATCTYRTEASFPWWLSTKGWPCSWPPPAFPLMHPHTYYSKGRSKTCHSPNLCNPIFCHKSLTPAKDSSWHIYTDKLNLANAFFPINSTKLNFAPGIMPATIHYFKLVGSK
jgi:hypothetical protein